MNAETLKTIASNLLKTDQNRVTEENAACPALVGLRFFETPLFGIADAGDPMFETLRAPEIVHPEVLLPADALSSAKRVIAWFLPFTRAVRTANRESMSVPSGAWLQARIEGQDAVFALGDAICRALEAEGFSAVQVSNSEKFKLLNPTAAIGRSAMSRTLRGSARSGCRGAL